jgi:hypothetical protein
MLDVQLFGLGPGGHHAVSLVLHALNALLLAFVLSRLTGGWWRSVLVAGLFALHPLRVESVVWIAERKDVLSAFFFLLMVDAYRRWVGRPTAACYALVVSGLTLGLMLKPMVVMLPCVLVLLDVWPLGRLRGEGRGSRTGGTLRSVAGLIAERWPLFALAVASSVVTYLVQRQTGAMVSTEVISAGRRVLNALISYWRYGGKTPWPSDLAVFYPYALAVHAAASGLAAAALAALTVLALQQGRKRPHVAVGWVWYVGTLVPVIGVIQVGQQAWADRYTYIPAIGLLISGRVGDGRAGIRLAPRQAGGFGRLRARPAGPGSSHHAAGDALEGLAHALRPRPGRDP